KVVSIAEKWSGQARDAPTSALTCQDGGPMRLPGTAHILVLAVMVASALLVTVAGCDIQTNEQRKPHTTLFVGVDASGSFKHSGFYEDALTFLAHYIYGHLNELGGLDKPQALFVGSAGGKSRGEPKTFNPIHDFTRKSI